MSTPGVLPSLVDVDANLASWSSWIDPPSVERNDASIWLGSRAQSLYLYMYTKGHLMTFIARPPVVKYRELSEMVSIRGPIRPSVGLIGLYSRFSLLCLANTLFSYTIFYVDQNVTSSITLLP